MPLMKNVRLSGKGDKRVVILVGKKNLEVKKNGKYKNDGKHRTRNDPGKAFEHYVNAFLRNIGAN